MISNLDQLTEVSIAYHKQKYGYIPNFLTPAQTMSWLESLEPLPRKRVICGNREVSWEQQQVDKDHRLYEYFLSNEVVTFIRSLEQVSPDTTYRVMSWTSRYTVGEFINPHRDASGDIQLLICLKSVVPGCGGALILRPDEQERVFNLQPGDAVIFKASEILHYTKPIVNSEQDLNPERVVIVARYYAR